MSSFNGGVWVSLKFNLGRPGAPIVPVFRYRIKHQSSDVAYRNPRYKSVLVHASKQLAVSTAEGLVHKLFPRYLKRKEKIQRDMSLERSEKHRVSILNNIQSQEENWGQIKAEGNNLVVARDKYGHKVKEALILYYNSDEQHSVENYSYMDSLKVLTNTYKTKTIWHIDLAPKVSFNSSKNIVMTRVQGRDFTRKELVSGGDITFSVSGNIVSNDDGVYPANEVKKFVKIMQYSGILNINFMTLNVLGIKRVIVTEFSLGESDFKNEQPYRFSCVAVEPDEDIKIVKDTIETINEDLQNSPQNSWLNMILDSKMAQMKAGEALDLAIDKLITKI